MTRSKQIEHIVVIGGGAGGLELVTQLGHELGKHKLARITLVDKNLTHLWKPLLHEVAAGTLNVNDNEMSYLVHATKHHYDFQLGEVVSVDRATKQIKLAAYQNRDHVTILPERTLHYDKLIFAVGSEANDFGVVGAREYCSSLEDVKQAESFHQALLECLFKSQYENMDIHIAIIGAGATGVELAAELQFALSNVHHFGFKKIKECHLKLYLIEAGPRILAALPEKVAKATENELKQIGVNVLTDHAVERITADGIYIKDGKFIPAKMKVWTAGIKAPAFLANLAGLTTNRLNQLEVTRQLQSSIDPAIFALGDCAAVLQKDGQQYVPALAQAAHQQAKLLTKSLKRQLQGKSLLDFEFHYRGSLISISHYSTIGYLMGRLPGRLMLEGKVARFLYLMLYKAHQVTLLGLWRTLVISMCNALTHRIRPKLKLH